MICAPPTHADTPPPAPLPAAGGAGAIRLIALDLDGTLLHSDLVLSARNTRAIRRAMEKGVRVVLASARPPRAVRPIYQHLKLDTLSANYNGALIHHPPRKRNVFHQPLDQGLVLQIARLARKVDQDTVVSIEILDKWYTDHVNDALPTQTSRVFAPDFVGPLEAILRVPVTKLMLLHRPRALTKVRQAVARKFAGRIALAISDEHLLQIIHPQACKGAALARIAGHYGVEARQVMAIGDAPNDLGMLGWAGLGLAVDNAWDCVKKAAHAIIPSNDADGVAEAIERYVLSKD